MQLNYSPPYYKEINNTLRKAVPIVHHSPALLSPILFLFLPLMIPLLNTFSITHCATSLLYHHPSKPSYRTLLPPNMYINQFLMISRYTTLPPESNGFQKLNPPLPLDAPIVFTVLYPPSLTPLILLSN